MGLAFHYRGKLRDYKEIDRLMEEVIDLCKGLNWSYQVFNDERIKGIVTGAEESEPLWFTFTPDGQTCNLVNLQYTDPSDPYYNWSAVKTQYAGPEAHMTTIKMLRYMSDKYFSEIEVMDEGEYWETGDEQKLREIFDRYTFIINAFAEKLESLERIPGESEESLVSRIEEMAKEIGGEVEVIRVVNEEKEDGS